MASLIGRRGHRRLPRLIALAAGALIALTPLAASTAAHAATASGPPARAATIGAPPATGTLTASATSIPNGTSITFTYSVPQAALSSTNWVGIYEPGQVPGQVGSTTWQYTPNSSGTVTFSAGSMGGVGTYEAYYLYNNGYDVLAGPVTFQVTAGHPAPAPAFSKAIGQHQLAGPYGVATDASGNIWVADTGHDSIAEFSPDGRPLTIAGFLAGLRKPEGIALDPAGDIWVADTGNNRIAELGRNGRLIARFGTQGSGSGQLNQPVALTVAGNTVYVADQGNSRIEEFTTAGGYVASISVPTPAGVALDGSGDIWVSSPSYANGNSVYEFSAAGQQLTSFGNTQAGYGDLGNTGGIAAGPGGRIYVTQPDYGWVTVFTAGGSFYTEFGLQSDTGLAGENLQFPQSLAIAPDGTIYVADSGTNRVVEFAPAGSAPGAAAVAPGPGGPSVPLIVALSLLALALAAGGIAWLLRTRRRPAAKPTAKPTAPVMCEMPDAKTAEPFELTRRRLLAGATALSGVAAAGALPLSVRKQLAATMNNPPGGNLNSIEHIVILMQENRSFDHYFGTFPGVRGFADPTAIKLPNGDPVFYQPDPSHAQGYLTPFHYDTKSTSAQATPGTDHSWTTQHEAWNNGAMDQWVKAKGQFTMGYFAQEDIPFHWALAQAFTICDNYHCSVLGPTNPNRLHMFTGMLDPAGTGGGPIIDNSPAFNNVILSWTTFPERLQRAGLSWQVYQEEDNYDDNSLAWFKQYGNASASSPLWQRGMQKRPAGWFEADARAGRLPQVSWLVAPTAQTEHPDYFPAAGAEYIASKLDAIASNPDLWHKTLFILTYDENDGIFDHVPPPSPPAGTADEFVQGEPIGLGFRVPCTVISPWTAGGRVYSGVLDHTSLIRVVETRFGVIEPNISAWRRQACGDFTGALRFGQQAGYPRSNQAISLAAAEAGLLTAQAEVFNNPRPQVPAVNEPLPPQ